MYLGSSSHAMENLAGLLNGCNQSYFLCIINNCPIRLMNKKYASLEKNLTKMQITCEIQFIFIHYKFF